MPTRPGTRTNARAYTHTHTQICNIYCFSTAVMIRERVSMLRYTYVSCLATYIFWLLNALRLLYVPPGMTLNSCTFCPHSVFMCFVCIWEQTAIISLYSINWLVFITETVRVYCAVRSAHTVYLCVLSGSENKRRLFHCTALTDWFL
jgi:hypothetical protein